MVYFRAIEVINYQSKLEKIYTVQNFKYLTLTQNHTEKEEKDKFSFTLMSHVKADFIHIYCKLTGNIFVILFTFMLLIIFSSVRFRFPQTQIVGCSNMQKTMSRKCVGNPFQETLQKGTQTQDKWIFLHMQLVLSFPSLACGH